jgi:hypothetical protein
MYFRQFLGRIVRRVPNLKALQVAYCYLPADPCLIKLAEEIENEIRHCIRPTGDDLFDPDERRARNDDRPDKPSWEALSSTNSGLSSVIVHGNQLSLFSGVADTSSLEEVVTKNVVARLDERRTRAEEKAFLTQELRKLVNILHKRTALSHAQIHAKLNAAQKVKSQTSCTEQELRERINLMRKMLYGVS